MLVVKVARPLGAAGEIALDARLHVSTPVKRARLKQQGRHPRVTRRLTDDDAGTAIGVRVCSLHTQVAQAQVHGAGDAAQLGDVGENVVADVVDNDLTRGGTTAFGHILHDLGFEQLDIGFEDRHVRFPSA